MNAHMHDTRIYACMHVFMGAHACMHAWIHACVFLCTHAWTLGHERMYACENILMYACPRMYAFPRMHVHMHEYIHARIDACADVLMCGFAGGTWERCRFREFAEMREEHRLKQEELGIKREIVLK